MSKVIVAPSILAADFSRLADEVHRVEQAGADWIHCDIMDGHFVDNISFGPEIVGIVRKETRLPLDVHLMIQTDGNPFFLEELLHTPIAPADGSFALTKGVKDVIGRRLDRLTPETLGTLTLAAVPVFP